MQRLAIALDQFIDETTVHLTAEQRHYLLNVLRLRGGDRLVLLDGLGNGWLGSLADSERVTVLEPYDFQTELGIPVTLVAALPKNGFDEVVRCCTELGVTQIIPVISARTVLKPSGNKVTRWQKIATEAAEQSERARIPLVLEPLTFTNYLKTLAATESAYFCAARGRSPYFLEALGQHSTATKTGITVCVGCEGGWTEAEIDQAIAKGMTVVSLGSSILRAVTASITAIALVNSFCNQSSSTYP